MLGVYTTSPSSHAYINISDWEKHLKQITHNLTTYLQSIDGKSQFYYQKQSLTFS